MEENKQKNIEEPTEIDYKEKAEEYLNNWKRERADFLNYKKDESKRIEEFAKYANEDVIIEAIEVLDDLELAAKEIKNEGLDSIIKKFQDLFKKYGVEKIIVEGKFDPAIHEAIETESDGNKIQEVRSGYMMRDKLLRPARVKIIK
jgi:molecular chaperone GrpE